MAKGDSDKINQAKQQQQKAEDYRVNTSQPRYNTFNTGALNDVTNAHTQGADERGYLTNAYRTGLETPYSMPGQNGLSGSSSGGGSSDSGGGSGGGGGTPSAPSDPWSTSFGLYGNFANGGGVDMGALTEALPGFRNMAQSGGFSADQLATLGNVNKGFGDIAANPFDASSLASINSNIGNLSSYGSSGGYDPAALARIRGDIQNMRGLSANGGYDPSQLATLRGYVGQLGNFNADFGQTPQDIQKLRDWGTTGGYSDQDIANERLRGSSTVSALYKNQMDNLARQRAITGGLTPGYGAAQRAMTRDLAQQQADAALNTENTLQTNIRNNKFQGMQAATTAGLQQAQIANMLRLYGLQGAAQTGNALESGVAGNRISALNMAAQGEGNLESNLASNRISAANQAASQGISLGNTLAQNRMAALTGQRDTTMGQVSTANDAILRALTGISSTNQGAQQLAQQGKMFGTTGIFNVESAREQAAQAAAARAAASGASSAGLAQQNSQFNAQMAEMQREFNLSGLQKLYGTADPTLAAANQTFLAGQGQQDSSNLQYLNFGMPYSPPQSQGGFSWRDALGLGSSVLGAFGGGGSGSGATTGGNGFSFGGGGYGDSGFYGGGYQFGGGGGYSDPNWGDIGQTIPNPSL